MLIQRKICMLLLHAEIVEFLHAEIVKFLHDVTTCWYNDILHIVTTKFYLLKQ
jgi:hypothetical protein